MPIDQFGAYLVKPKSSVLSGLGGKQDIQGKPTNRMFWARNGLDCAASVLLFS